MELESIMLSKISQSENSKYHMILLISGIKETKQISKGETERENMSERGKPSNICLIIENELIFTRREIGDGD